MSDNTGHNGKQICNTDIEYLSIQAAKHLTSCSTFPHRCLNDISNNIQNQSLSVSQKYVLWLVFLISTRPDRVYWPKKISDCSHILTFTSKLSPSMTWPVFKIQLDFNISPIFLPHFQPQGTSQNIVSINKYFVNESMNKNSFSHLQDQMCIYVTSVFYGFLFDYI